MLQCFNSVLWCAHFPKCTADSFTFDGFGKSAGTSQLCWMDVCPLRSLADKELRSMTWLRNDAGVMYQGWMAYQFCACRNAAASGLFWHRPICTICRMPTRNERSLCSQFAVSSTSLHFSKLPYERCKYPTLRRFEGVLCRRRSVGRRRVWSRRKAEPWI